MDPMGHSPKSLAVGFPAAVVLPGEIPANDHGPEPPASVDFATLGQFKTLPAGLDLVIAPLFCADFDALELIELLGTLGFRGRIRVVVPRLPNRQIVLRELRAHAVRQGITVEMVERD